MLQTYTYYYADSLFGITVYFIAFVDNESMRTATLLWNASLF